jgi:hypothetical protein
MSWPALGKEPVVDTIIHVDKITAKRAVQRWASEIEE